MGSRPGGRGKRRLQCWAVTAGLLLLGCALSGALLALDHTGGFVSMIFVLVVVLVARLTDGYAYGAAASFVGVVCVNYIFTYPYWEFNFTISGYPLTFFTMLSVSLIVSALTSQIKRQEQLRVETDRETMRANLLRAVSHDLRTPLTSIVGSASAILENDALLPPQQKTALLRNVRSEAQWLIRMVENLLSITRMGDGTARLSKELEAAEEVLSSVAGKFQQRFPGIQLTLTAPGAVFTVRDNGLGIPEEILPEIFSPALPSKLHAGDDRRNMGIGLSVCSSIVKAHGGSMSACNVREGGAMFRFTLPMEESEEVLS